MAKPKPKPGSVTILSLRLPTDLRNQVAVIADRSGRSLNSEIIVALREMYAKPLDQNGISSLNAPPAAGAAAAPGDALGEGSAA